MSSYEMNDWERVSRESEQRHEAALKAWAADLASDPHLLESELKNIHRRLQTLQRSDMKVTCGQAGILNMAVKGLDDLLNRRPKTYVGGAGGTGHGDGKIVSYSA